jgi:hypothetical protein
MDFYQGTPNLPMTGGDIFSSIQNEIDVLNDTVVFKAGTQTITGDKTITGDLVVTNNFTSIGGAFVGLVSDDLRLNGAGGATKYQHDATTTIIDNTDVVQLRLGGSSVFSALASPHDTTITGDDNVYINSGGGTSKVDITPTNTIIENDYLMLKAATTITNDINGTTKLTTNSMDTTLTNGEIYLTSTTGLIEVQAADGVIINGLSSGVELEVNNVNKLNLSPTTTTLTNTDIFVKDTATNNTLAKFSETETIIAAPNFGSTLDINFGDLLRFNSNNATNAGLFIGLGNPVDLTLNGQLNLQDSDVITQNVVSTGSRSMGIFAPSTTTGDLIFTLNQRTSAVNFTASGYTLRRVNGGNFRFNRQSTSSGGITTQQVIQEISGAGTVETFTMATQTKVASTAFKVQTVAGTDKLNIGATDTTLTNTNIYLRASTANFLFTNAVEKLACYSASTYITNNDIINNAGSLYQVNIGGTEKFAISGTDCVIKNSNFIGIYSNNILRMEVYPTGNYYNFNPTGSAAQRWRFYDNGTTNRMYLLQGAAANGVQLASGANAWSAWSDERVKKNITPVDTELNNVLKLRPVFYNYKKDAETQPKRVGFIAQELQKVYPELVDEGEMSVGDVDNVLTVETTSLIPYLVKAIQDLNKKVEELTLRCSGGKTAETDISL